MATKTYRLTRRLPDGTIKAQSTEFGSLPAVRRMVAFILHVNGAVATRTDANVWARENITVANSTVQHPSGYVFWVEEV